MSFYSQGKINDKFNFPVQRYDDTLRALKLKINVYNYNILGICVGQSIYS